MSLIFKVISGLRPKIKSLSSVYYFSTSSNHQSKNVLQHLQNRSLVKVKGSEAAPYLQGLITNDMRHLEDGAGSMYAMFLNTRGRILYDSIIYATEDPEAYLLECDKSVVDNFQKHLKVFRVKKKIDLEINPLNIWALFDTTCASNIDYNEIDKMQTNLKVNMPVSKFVKKDNIFVYKDPRIHLLGSRILCDTSMTKNDLIERLNIEDIINTDEDCYKNFRYGLGVGEGVEDLPPGNCFPLEANADFLHGVSFHKGCYIGQELTARTHHTGVVRKRLMPLLFKSVINKIITSDTSVFPLNDNKTAIGKVRGITSQTGLGLLRIVQALDATALDVSGCEAKTYRPHWWPTEAPKEKILTTQEES